jgi:hypothetical protein
MENPFVFGGLLALSLGVAAYGAVLWAKANSNAESGLESKGILSAAIRRGSVLLDRSRSKLNGLRRPWTVGAVVAIGYFVANAPAVVLTEFNVADEGNRLASASFASKGLLLHRDYYTPYGPGRDYIGALVRRVGLDSILSHRLVFFGFGLLLALLVTVLVTRRRGPMTGAFIGVLMILFASFLGDTYTLCYLLVVGALMVLEMSRLGSGVLPLVESGDLADRRALQAGYLVALAAWIRPEFAVLTAIWLLLVVTRPSVSTRTNLRTWLWKPVLLGAGPYIALALAGALPHMISVLSHLSSSHSEYGGSPADYGGVVTLMSSIGNVANLDRDAVIFAMSFSAALIALPLLWSGRLFDRWHLSGWRVLERDESRVSVLVGAMVPLVWFDADSG